MRRLMLSLCIAVLLATAGLSWFFDYIFSRYQENEQAIKPFGEDSIDSTVAQLIDTVNHLDDKGQFLAVWNDSGDFKAELQHRNEFSIPEPLIRKLEAGEVVKLVREDHLAALAFLSGSDEFLLVTYPSHMLGGKGGGDGTGYDSTRLLFTLSFYIAIIGIFLIWLLPLLLRLNKLRHTAKALGKGDLSCRMDTTSISYIKDIEVEFNRMAQQIEDLVGDIKFITSSVSHEIRNPLARMRMGLDVLRETNDKDKNETYIRRLHSTVDEMSDLIDSLLRYSRLDKSLSESSKEPLDLAALIDSIVEKYDYSNIDVTFNVPEDHNEIMGNRFYLELLVSNLIKNATRYAKSKIQVTLAKADNVVLSVEDDGKGFDNEILETATQPFVRSVEGNGKASGFGLGLAIVKRIATWHKGNVILGRSSTLHGAKVTVNFELA